MKGELFEKIKRFGIEVGDTLVHPNYYRSFHKAKIKEITKCPKKTKDHPHSYICDICPGLIAMGEDEKQKCLFWLFRLYLTDVIKKADEGKQRREDMDEKRKKRSLEIAKLLEVGNEVRIDWSVISTHKIPPPNVPNGVYVVTKIEPCPHKGNTCRTNVCKGKIELNGGLGPGCFMYQGCFPFADVAEHEKLFRKYRKVSIKPQNDFDPYILEIKVDTQEDHDALMSFFSSRGEEKGIIAEIKERLESVS